MNVCSKCQLPTAEADLVHSDRQPSVCTSCLPPAPNGEIKASWPSNSSVYIPASVSVPEAADVLSEARACYDKHQNSLRERLGYPVPTPDGPVVSPAKNYRPGRYLYGVEYQGHLTKGTMSLKSVAEVERAIRDIYKDGGRVKRVYEVQELLGEEPGTPCETVFMGDWSQERIRFYCNPEDYRVTKNRRYAETYGYKPRLRLVTEEQLKEGWVKLFPDGRQEKHTYHITRRINNTTWGVLEPVDLDRDLDRLAAGEVLYGKVVRDRIRENEEQAIVQLAGCLTAVEGHRPDPPLKQGDYGWSLAYQKILELRNERDQFKAELYQRDTSAQGREAVAVLLPEGQRGAVPAGGGVSSGTERL